VLGNDLDISAVGTIKRDASIKMYPSLQEQISISEMYSQVSRITNQLQAMIPWYIAACLRKGIAGAGIC